MKFPIKLPHGFKYRLRRYALLLGFGGMALVWVTAATLDWGFGQDVLIVSPQDQSTIELNRALYTPGEPVANIYGNPMSQPVRVIFPRADRIIRPPRSLHSASCFLDTLP